MNDTESDKIKAKQIDYVNKTATLNSIMEPVFDTERKLRSCPTKDRRQLEQQLRLFKSKLESPETLQLQNQIKQLRDEIIKLTGNDPDSPNFICPPKR
jgi:hypothetical protein